jgi:hypothetical protein
MKAVFVDRFVVPPHAIQEFIRRMAYSREFIARLPGLTEDRAYERTDENGNLLVITLATWESESAMNSAKEAVLAEYGRIGFRPAEMFSRLNISMERGTYREITKNH